MIWTDLTEQAYEELMNPARRCIICGMPVPLDFSGLGQATYKRTGWYSNAWLEGDQTVGQWYACHEDFSKDGGRTVWNKAYELRKLSKNG